MDRRQGTEGITRGRFGRRRALGWASSALVLVVGLLALSQLLLPGIVASKLRSSLNGTASDVHLSVQATPALKLLFGQADRVTMSIGRLRPSGNANIKNLLARTREAGSLHATVSELLTERLALDDVSVVKHGDVIETSAAVNRTALAAALPAGLAVAPSEGGSQGVALAYHLKLLGQSVNVTALLEARDGNIEIVPSSNLIPDITVFTDPQLYVDGVHIVAHGDSYTFSAQGRLS